MHAWQGLKQTFRLPGQPSGNVPSLQNLISDVEMHSELNQLDRMVLPPDAVARRYQIRRRQRLPDHAGVVYVLQCLCPSCTPEAPLAGRHPGSVQSSGQGKGSGWPYLEGSNPLPQAALRIAGARQLLLQRFRLLFMRQIRPRPCLSCRLRCSLLPLRLALEGGRYCMWRGLHP